MRVGCLGVVASALATFSLPGPAPAQFRPLPPESPAAHAPPVSCLPQIIRELAKRPHWELRIEDRRWVDYDLAGEHHATIVAGSSGVTWRDQWTQQQAFPLTARELLNVVAAIALPSDVDPLLQLHARHGYEGRYFLIALGRGEPTEVRIPYRSPAAMRAGDVFDAIRARYVADRAVAARGFVLKLSGQVRSGAREWTPYAIEIDGRQPEADDASLVALVDWARAFPPSLPRSRKVATGTLTVGGETRLVAVTLDPALPESHVLSRISLATELWMWMSINRK